jgi:hypothetical protein
MSSQTSELREYQLLHALRAVTMTFLLFLLRLVLWLVPHASARLAPVRAGREGRPATQPPSASHEEETECLWLPGLGWLTLSRVGGVQWLEAPGRAAPGCSPTARCRDRGR